MRLKAARIVKVVSAGLDIRAFLWADLSLRGVMESVREGVGRFGGRGGI